MSSRKLPPRRDGAADEAGLVADLKTGKPRSFDRFHDENVPQMFRLAYLLTGKIETATEIIETVVTRFLERSAVRRTEDDLLSEWLLMLVVHEVMQRSRKEAAERAPSPARRRRKGSKGPAPSGAPRIRPLREGGDDNRYTEEGSLQPIADWSGRADDEEDRRRLRETLTGNILRLPPYLSGVWVLADVMGQEVTSIARLMDLPGSDVRSRIHRARTVLRDAFNRTIARGLEEPAS